MMWIVTPAAVVLWLSSTVALIVAWIAVRRGPFPGSKIFPLLMLAVAEWSLSAGFEAASVHVAEKIVFSMIEYVGLAATPVLFLIFAARHSGYKRWFTGRLKAVVWIPAIGIVAIAATNELHHWLWSQYLPGPAGSNLIIYVHGPAYHAITTYIYACIVVGCILVAGSAIRHSGPRRRQAIIILFSSAFPVVASILYVAKVPVAPGLDLTPVSFLLTGLVLLTGIAFFRVFDLVPEARNALIEQTLDAVIVVDANGLVVDANPTANQWFGRGRPLVGQAVADTFSAWPQLRDACSDSRSSRVEVTLEENPLRHVDVHITSVQESRGQPAGSFIVFRDITPRYRNELALHRANNALALRVREIEALHDQLREQAIRDGLTGLFNRRYLDEILPRELERAGHEGSVVSVVMIDIDQFKATNDQHGHREGDRILSLLGSVLRESTRPSDTACRYGGEEFLLVLPNTLPDVACHRIERLREKYAARLQDEEFESPPTLSVGVAVFPAHSKSDDGLLRAADQALYRAKAEGRDRVCLAEVTAEA